VLSCSSADSTSGDSELDGWSGSCVHKLSMISQRSRTIFQVANVWDRAKEFADDQAQGSMCETQVRLTNSSLELKFYLLCTIYTRDMTQKESFRSRAIVSHNSWLLASHNESLVHESRWITYESYCTQVSTSHKVMSQVTCPRSITSSPS